MGKSIYSEELSEQILDLIRAGKTLRDACAEIDIPISTAYRWKGRNHEKFGDRYFHACQDRALAWSDEILTIADECPPREIDVKRAGLKIRARQWLIEKQAPTIFAPVVARADEVLLENPMDFLKTWKEKNSKEVAT